MGRLICTFIDFAEEQAELHGLRGPRSYQMQYPDEYFWAGENDEEEEPRHALEADGIVLR